MNDDAMAAGDGMAGDSMAGDAMADDAAMAAALAPARYQVVFSSRWTEKDHPLDYPGPKFAGLSVALVDPHTVKLHRTSRHGAALGSQDTRDGLERGALPGPVRSQKRHDLPIRHLKRHAAQHQDRPVVYHLDIIELQHA